MHIWNIRRAFATNSSSSHSMLILDDATQLKENPENGHYGWQAFTLTSTDDKKRYLANLIGQALNSQVGADVTNQVLRDLSVIGPTESMSLDPDDYEWGVDHQSQITLPQSSDLSSANVQFIKEFVAWSLSSNVAILGGNDNDGEHPDLDKGVNISWREWLSQDLRAWKDPTNNTWSLFSKRNGLTLRLSFDDVEHTQYNYSGLSNEASHRPNLVDIKITDSCPFQCTYCYQGSTPKAPHAPYSKIVELAQALSKEKVFEVALGGGEPTLHPNFKDILKVFHDQSITPNFTTRNLKWIENPASIEALKMVGGFAVSVDNIKGTQQALDAIEKMVTNGAAQYIRPQTSIQIVLGTQTEQEFKDMLRLIMSKNDGPKITLLGYKNTGFGSSYRVSEKKEQQIIQAQNHWLDWMKEAFNEVEAQKEQQHIASGFRHKYYPSRFWFNVDTAVAQVSGPQLDELKGSKTMYHTIEGAQSMYIDAVASTMAPSSFAPVEQSVAWSADNWLSQFHQFTPKKHQRKMK